jgi:hypothetical protein
VQQAGNSRLAETNVFTELNDLVFKFILKSYLTRLTQQVVQFFEQFRQEIVQQNVAKIENFNNSDKSYQEP